jgi:hypothetical protein
MSDYIHPGPHPDADQLNAFMEGVLPEHERLESLAHLAECSRCRQLVFLAQEPETALVAAKITPMWRSWFGLVPVFSAALAGAVLVIVFLHLHHTAKEPVPNQVARVEPLPPVITAPTQQSPVETKTAPLKLKPATRQVAVAQPQPAPVVQTQQPPVSQTQQNSLSQTNQNSVTQANQSTFGQMGGAVFPHGPAANQALPRRYRGAASGQGYALNNPAAPSDNAVAKTSIHGTLFPNNPDANASGTAMAPAPAAAPPLLQDKAVAASRPQQLPINGRNASLSSRDEIGGLATSSLNGPLRLSVEHNHGSVGGLSEVTGLVTDPSGAVVPRATVTARRLVETAGSEATTDASGRFTLAALPAGKYEVRITAPGFATVSQQIELQSRDLALLTSVLPIGAMSEAVTVNAETTQIETESEDNRRALKRKRLLPGKLPTVTSVSIGNRTLALDSEGTLFLSKDGEKHWQTIKPSWQGQISQLVLLPARPPSSVTQSQNANLDVGAAGLAVSPKRFQLTTDAHAVWISKDGVHWRPL